MDKKTASQDWHWADITAAVKKSRFGSFTNLARHYKLRTVSGLTLVKDRPFRLGEQRIAAAIGVRPEVIWPSRWHPDGTRKTRTEMMIERGWKKSTPLREADNVNSSQRSVEEPERDVAMVP
jgi:Ner family transcriptional regulator